MRRGVKFVQINKNSHATKFGVNSGLMKVPEELKEKASLSDYLAAERTLLAWIRTGLALMGFGFVVARFGIFLTQIQIAQNRPSGSSYGLSLWFGTALIASGVFLSISAGLHHLRLIRNLDRGGAARPHLTSLAVLTALFLALIGIGMTIYLISIRS
jgi:putative membrane protein